MLRHDLDRAATFQSPLFSLSVHVRFVLLDADRLTASHDGYFVFTTEWLRFEKKQHLILEQFRSAEQSL